MNMIKLIQDGCEEAVRLSPRRLGEADDQYSVRTEDRAANIYYAAEAEFLARVQDAWALTDVCKDEMQGVIDSIHDARISRETWEAKVRG